MPSDPGVYVSGSAYDCSIAIDFIEGLVGMASVEGWWGAYVPNVVGSVCFLHACSMRPASCINSVSAPPTGPPLVGAVYVPAGSPYIVAVCAK